MHSNKATHTPPRSLYRRLLVIFSRILISVLILLIFVIILVQTPFVQDIIRSKAEQYLSRKLNTRVGIGKLYIGFPTTVRLQNIFIADRQKDTLLYAGLINVNVGMWKLLHSNIDIGRLQLENITLKLQRRMPDTVFNFQFITEAFAGKKPEQPASKDTSTLKMALHTLELDKIRLVYNDVVSGNDVEIAIGHSQTDIDGFDLNKGQFNITGFQLKGMNARVYKHMVALAGQKAGLANAAPAASQPAAAASASLQFRLGRLALEDIVLDYRDTAGAFFTALGLGQVEGREINFDLSGKMIRLSNLQLNKTIAAIHIGRAAKKTPATGNSAQAAGNGTDKGWQVEAGSLQLNEDHIRYDDDNKRRQARGMDYAHLDIVRLFLHVSDLLYNMDSVRGTFTKGEFAEKSGFELDKLHTNFLYTHNQAWLKDLELKTPGSLLQRSLVLKFSSPASITTNPGRTLVDMDLANSRVQIKDILLFSPALYTQPAFRHPDAVWLINARAKGSLASLNLVTLQCSGLYDTKIDLSGIIRNPTDSKKIKAWLVIRTLASSQRDLALLLPSGSLPTTIAIPARFDANGKLAGGLDSLYTDLSLHSSAGGVAVKGFIMQPGDSRNAAYDATIRTSALDLGYILKNQDQFGQVTAVFDAKGRGFDPKYADATLHGDIVSAILKKYEYRDFQFDGKIAQQQLNLQASIHNEAVSFDLQADAGLAGRFPSVKLDWQIDTLDLHALHLVKDSLQLKGHITADFTDTNPDSLQGTLKISSLLVVDSLRRLFTDSILLVATRNERGEAIQFRSEMAAIDWNGRYKITEVVPALEQVFNKYYKLNGFKEAKLSPQDWEMKMTLRASPLVLTLLPALKGTDSIGAQLSFNSDRQDLQFSLQAPRIKYGTQTIEQAGVNVSAAGEQLNYKIGFAKADANGIRLYQTSLFGYVANNTLHSSFLFKDEKGKDKYHLAGQLDQKGQLDKNGQLNKKVKDLVFKLDADSLLLNYENWQVSRDNFFHYSNSGLVVNDFAITHEGESLRINSNPPAPSSPMDVSFANFRISTLTTFTGQDSLLLDGQMNGKVQVKNIFSNPVFTSDLFVKDLSYKKDTVGDFSVKVNNEKANAFSADISIVGHNNDIRLQGEYYTGESRVDMKLDLNRLNLATIKPFTASQVQDMKGILKGSLAVKGTMDKPEFRGGLHFDSAVITPLLTGEPLSMSKDNIEFDEEGFNFSHFVFRDSASNRATIDGNVYTKDYRNYNFDVTFNADNFTMVNAPQASKRLFYGRLNVDAAANLTGDINSLKADGDLRVNKNTDFTLVLPSSDPEVVNRQGVVVFVDKAHPDYGDSLSAHALDSIRQASPVQGMDISLNVETDSSAIFTMVIDERNGDALTVRGRSNLTFGMDKSGKMDMTGNYEVESGVYNLSLDVLKRKFNIQRGSMITWTGDPTSALIDLNATYAANTPSIDLIQNEIAGRSQADINKFNQKLPFLVSLKMQGELLKPKISFDITLPDNLLALWPDVDLKLQQIRMDESQLDKQVFALLVLNRFVGDNPLQSAGNGTSVSNIAFQSASQILTNQLNQLAESLIKGVDINFDLNKQQDFSTGTEYDYTELNVNVSKQLFNDRVRVNVGSNFDVQGTGAPNQNATNLAGNEAVDYKLSRDGRYLLRAYRKNQYEMAVAGQVVETGISFILTFDYNRFWEIFGHSRDSKLEERKLIQSKKKNNTN